jgi:hypothetical protein
MRAFTTPTNVSEGGNDITSESGDAFKSFNSLFGSDNLIYPSFNFKGRYGGGLVSTALRPNLVYPNNTFGGPLSLKRSYSNGND